MPDPNNVPVIMGNKKTKYKGIENSKYGLSFLIRHAISEHDCDNLIKLFDYAPVSAPVSVNGFMDGDTTAHYGGITGSTRTTMWSEKLSSNLWDKIKFNFGPRLMDELTATDWWQQENNADKKHLWKPAGLSPLMRFMRYELGGQHYAHYDAGYIYDDGAHRTLMSYVVYLTDNNSGATRFIKDGQESIPVWDRKHDDWDVEATDEDVKFSVLPEKGSILFFDHRMCHDVAKYESSTQDPRIIIRGDVIYKCD